MDNNSLLKIMDRNWKTGEEVKDGPRWTNESMHNKEEQVTTAFGLMPQKWRKDEQKNMVDKRGTGKNRRALSVGGW